MWITVGLSVVALIIFALMSRRRRLGRLSDLGSVSEQWMSDYRAGHGGDRLH